MKFLRLTALLLLILNLSLHSQELNNVQPNLLLRNINIIKSIENEYKIHCFYHDVWLEESELKRIELTGNIENDLQSIFSKTKLFYFLYQNKFLIITKSRKLDLTFTGRSSEEINYVNDANSIDLNEIVKDERKVHTIGVPGNSNKIVALSGNIKEYSLGQLLPNVAVIADNGTIGTTTDENGNYKLFLSKGYHSIVYQHIGFRPSIRKVEIFSDGVLNIPLIISSNLLEEVIILTDYKKDENKQTGYEYIEMADIKEIPSFMGEPDIIKYSLLLPGIQSAGEADMSFNVRGGKGDQNLILLDGMHTYSYSHFFGFFPGINPESISSSKIYKSSIPVEYGNKISSVYDIAIKSGNLQKLKVNGGISPVSVNAIIEGPIYKDKVSFSIGGRSTYSNWVLDQIDVKELDQSSVDFYDLQTKFKYFYNSNSYVSLFLYKSNDQFSFHHDTAYAFDNQIASANWNWYINDKFKLNFIGGYTNYYSKKLETPSIESASLKEQKIKDFKLNSHVTANLNHQKFTGGLEAIYHEVLPWSLSKENQQSLITPIQLDKDKAIEGAIFLGDKLSILNQRLLINIGLRYSMFSSIGPDQEFIYANNNITSENIIDTTYHSKNELTGFNSGLEVRITANYKIKNNQNINFSFDRNRQYIHLLSNTQAASPSDSWQLSNKYITPQVGNQFSLGYNINSIKNKYSGSIELYYKRLEGIKDFINGSNFIFSQHPETEIINAKGKSYGIELLLKKNGDKINGWISYTYSRAYIKSSTDNLEKLINKGEYYPASFDKPHNLSAIINLEPSRRIILSSVFNYSSGVPVTLPVAKMEINDGYSIIYSERNEYRLPYYLRWDLSITYRGNLKRKKLVSSEIMFSVYNVTGRMNAYSVYYKNTNDNIQGYKLSIFGKPIPTLTYKFSF